jgi:uncharacterized OB-fold protein
VSADPTILTASFTLEYTFKRSLGPVLGAFFEGLREGRVLGMRTRTGRVLVPPSEYDPDTGESLSDLTPVSDRGVVTTFTWVPAPGRQQPLKHPFAFALIKLDGSDVAMLHAVDTGGQREQMRIGMRVRANWASERTGAITDIASFVPDATGEQAP